MAKFVALPVVIEAVQYCGSGDHPALHLMHLSEGSYHYIQTLEGQMRVNPGDWIITGTKGEHYPCKDDIFRGKYAPVEEGDDEVMTMPNWKRVRWPVTFPEAD